MKKKQAPVILDNVLITDYAAEGKAIARHEGKVIFVSGAIPGDEVSIRLTKNKKDWAEAIVLSVNKPSADRMQPFCRHFGTCGGCKWQMLPYEKQLAFKEQEAAENLRRISKTELPPVMPIIGADSDRFYRNKLEFTFSNKRYLSREEIDRQEEIGQSNALGYHAPRIFDKVIDISECYLMDDINNQIRNTVKDFALEHGYAFYDIREHSGWLRNIIIRHTSTGETMVNICFNHDDESERIRLFDHLLNKVPAISTLLYTINPKWNDTIYDLEPQVYHGKGYVTEKLGDYSFIISPKSFFQTNSRQAKKLYDVALSFAGLSGGETVYDLYCGTGSIGIYLSAKAGRIIGVEAVADAIEDAKKNAALNGLTNTRFFAGDVIKVCTDGFFAEHGKPDVIITDPPRAGMHEKLVNKLLEIAAPRIVYVSCNTATQARDIGLLAEKYRVEKIQPVDMFPHTHHIECVALLTLR